MKVFTIVTDKNGTIQKYCVNAMSQKHGINKAYLYSIRAGNWPKRIQSFEEHAISDKGYSVDDFKSITVK